MNDTGPASLLGSGSEDANALYSASKRLMCPKFYSKHSDVYAYRNTFQIKRWNEHCTEREEEKMKRLQWRTHASVVQPCEDVAIVVVYVLCQKG